MSKQGSNNFLIISVILAILILGGAIAYVKISQNPTAAIAVAENIDIVSCASGGQCIVVDTNCGFCCDYKAINARHELSFNQSFDEKCSRYDGEFCKCFDLSSYPSCIEGKCQLVKWPDEKN